MSASMSIVLSHAARCGYRKEVQMDGHMKLLDATELGEILRISRGSVYRRRSLGEPLPRAVRIGSLIRWREQDVAEFLAANLETDPERGL